MKDDNSSQMFEFIFNSIKDKDALKLDKPLNSSSSKKSEKEDTFALRNAKYNNLISVYTDAYKARHDRKNSLKMIFFWVVMPVYVIVVLASLFILIMSLFVDTYGVVLVIGAIGSLITTLIAIPTIIANYLFPKQEDANLVDMFKLMFDFDTNYYNSINEAKAKASQKVNEEKDAQQ